MLISCKPPDCVTTDESSGYDDRHLVTLQLWDQIMALQTKIEDRIDVGPLTDLQRVGVKVIPAGDRSVAVFYSDGDVYAVDNRCPHMGFPLSRGTVRDGILTCHWHHAKFDLAGGCTFDPFADDVTSFNVEVEDGRIWLAPEPIEEDRREHWLRKVDEGLEQNISLVLAKAVIGLNGMNETTEVLRRAAVFAVQNRDGGWSDGLSILTAMANVLDYIDPEDRPLALFHGLQNVARATQGQTADFDLPPLTTDEARPERFIDWFRRFAEVRAADACERTLRTAIDIGLKRTDIEIMIFGAITDYLFLDGGHTLDFANKSFELVGHIGWSESQEILPSLVPQIVSARRMEETSSWRHPVVLPDLLGDTYRELDAAIEQGNESPREWDGHREIAELVIDGKPEETLGAMLQLLREGVALTELSSAVAYAAALRLAHFRVTNEFGDWDTVHHTFTYCNGVDQSLRRSPSNLTARGIFDGAMAVYLDRFLNVPKQAIPEQSGGSPGREDLLSLFDEQGKVDETARVVRDMISADGPDSVIAVLGHALLREDAGFHMFQVFEAGVRQYGNFRGRPEGDEILIGVARFLSAHSPTVRARRQTFDIAARLHRGESLSDE